MKANQMAAAENHWVSILDDHQNVEAIALARRLISEQIYCTLSTCSAEGLPWGSPLLFVSDQGFNLYWSSAIAAQHSQNLYQNQGRATVTIYDAAKIKAVYCAGIAQEFTDEHPLQQVLQVFDRRAKRPTARRIEDYLDPSPRRMYQFVIDKIWVTGDRLSVNNQLIDTKIQLSLTDLIDTNYAEI